MSNHETYLIFKGLADPHRIAILKIIQKEEICSCHLGERLEMPLSTLAHHMKMLIASGLVSTRKCGKWTYYSLDRKQIEVAKQTIEDLLTL